MRVKVRVKKGSVRVFLIFSVIHVCYQIIIKNSSPTKFQIVAPSVSRQLERASESDLDSLGHEDRCRTTSTLFCNVPQSEFSFYSVFPQVLSHQYENQMKNAVTLFHLVSIFTRRDETRRDETKLEICIVDFVFVLKR
jgi:hypothetical protein